MQFALLGLHFGDGVNFFRLLDVDGNRLLRIDEFVMGVPPFEGWRSPGGQQCADPGNQGLATKDCALPQQIP